MSWDILVQAAKFSPPPVAEMPKDWHGDVLGTGDEVRAKISLAIPGVNWTDPTWGVFDGDGFYFEFNMGKKESCDNFMIHVHGGGDAVSLLLYLAEQCGWYLLDTSEGEWLHRMPNAEKGWKGFQVFRDGVLGQSTLPEGE